MGLNARKKIVLLGATGSIGSNTLRVIRKHSDRLELVGVSAHSNYEALAKICAEFKVKNAVLTHPDAYQKACAEKTFDSDVQLSEGSESLEALATLDDADLVLVAVVGACGLKPALAAIDADKDLALANKELLVLGGSFLIECAQSKGVRLLPTDSEHNAIFQCLEGVGIEHVDQLILTASGGPFREASLGSLKTVTPAQAIQHPNWSMGKKISVDSATMANKGLELIEAHWLFGLPAERLKVVIHPQSIVHSFVQCLDGSVLAQMSPPTMTFPIQHCLLYPDRAPSVDATLDFGSVMDLNFTPVEYERYPCLTLAYEALKDSATGPAVFNAANEVAVEQFLKGSLQYLEIPKLIERSLEHFSGATVSNISDLFALDNEVRAHAQIFK